MKRILEMAALGLIVAAAAPHAAASIKVYVDKDYKGESIQIDAAIPDLRKLDFDDRISSLQADEPWLVCSAPRFKGDCREVEGSLVNLRQEGLNDRITSLKPVKHKREKSAIDVPGTPVPVAARLEWWGGAN